MPMDRPATLIDHLKSNQPATWSLLKLAATQGLASIDTVADTVLLKKDLQQRHQKLHSLMLRLMSEWDPQRGRFLAAPSSQSTN